MQGATTIHEDSADNTVSTSSLTMEVEAVTYMLSAGLSPEVTVKQHSFKELATKIEP